MRRRQAEVPPESLWREPEMSRLLAARDVAAFYRALGRLGWSQRAIGALTGQHQSEVCEILGGRRVVVYDLLVRLADGLGVPRGLMGLAHDRRAGLAAAVVRPRRPCAGPARRRRWSMSRWSMSRVVNGRAHATDEPAPGGVEAHIDEHDVRAGAGVDDAAVGADHREKGPPAVTSDLPTLATRGVAGAVDGAVDAVARHTADPLPRASLWHEPAMAKALAGHDLGAVYRAVGRLGWTQRSIATLTGQSPAEVRETTRGERVRSYEALARVADGLGVPRGLMGLASTVPACERCGHDPAVAVWTGLEVRALRKARRMSVRAFAAYLGVSDRMVSKWEAAGATTRPRPVNQAALDTALANADPEARLRFAAASAVVAR